VAANKPVPRGSSDATPCQSRTCVPTRAGVAANKPVPQDISAATKTVADPYGTSTIFPRVCPSASSANASRTRSSG